MVETPAGDRFLAWEGCCNVRDLGGLAAADGSRIRRGALVRADNLCRLTASGQAALMAHGVRTVIDLRATEELARAAHPFAAEKAEQGWPRYIHVPIFEVTDTATTAALAGEREVYGPNKVLLDRCGSGFATALRAITTAPEGGVLVHCFVGKDRTGLVVALTLAVAGVPPETIAADYAMSDFYLQPIYAEMLAECNGDEAAIADLKPRLTSHSDTMQRTLSYLDWKYGGPEGYLRGIGLTTDELAALRRRVLDQ